MAANAPGGLFAVLASSEPPRGETEGEDDDVDDAASTSDGEPEEENEDVLEERVALAAIYSDSVKWKGSRRMCASVAVSGTGGAPAAAGVSQLKESIGVQLLLFIPRGYPRTAVDIVSVRALDAEALSRDADEPSSVSLALSEAERELLHTSIQISLRELTVEAAREQRVVLYEVIEGAREALQTFIAERNSQTRIPLGVPGQSGRGLCWAVEEDDFIGDDQSLFDDAQNHGEAGNVTRQARRSLEVARQANYERQRAQSSESADVKIQAQAAPAHGSGDDRTSYPEGHVENPSNASPGAANAEDDTDGPHLARNGDKSFASRFGKSLSSLSSSFTSMFSTVAPKNVVQALKLHENLDMLPETDGIEQMSKHQQKKSRRKKSAKLNAGDAQLPSPQEKGDRSESVRKSVLRDLLLARLLSLAMTATAKPEEDDGVPETLSVRRSALPAAVMKDIITELEGMHVLPTWVLLMLSQKEEYLVKACDACLKSHVTLKRFLSRFAKVVKRTQQQNRRQRERFKEDRRREDSAARAGRAYNASDGNRGVDAGGNTDDDSDNHDDDDDDDNDDDEDGSELAKEVERDQLSIPSRLESDFIVQHRLGSGSFGSVCLARSRMDGRNYAIKRIPLIETEDGITSGVGADPNGVGMNEKLLREVSTLSSLQHQNVVRYYQAWVEKDDAVRRVDELLDEDDESDDLFDEGDSSAFSSSGRSRDGLLGSRSLFIAMEWCPRTLDNVIKARHEDANLSQENKWKQSWSDLRQILEGLRHIHDIGIIHRDLKPTNVFLDIRGDIKIGDFGLSRRAGSSGESQAQQHSGDASPLKGPRDVLTLSSEKTTQVGTYFYCAPEIDNGSHGYDEKVDMYSCGVVALELFYNFETGMERAVCLTELKRRQQKTPMSSLLPSCFSSPEAGEADARFQQARFISVALSTAPSARPTAAEVLTGDMLPSRLEDEAVSHLLRIIPSDTSLRAKALAAAFSSVAPSPSPQAFGASRRVGDASGGGKIELTEDPTRTAVSRHVSGASLFTMDRVIDVLRRYFQKHGGTPLRRDLLTNQVAKLTSVSTFRQQECRFAILDNPSHETVALRTEMRSRFADWISSNKIVDARHYQIGSVVRTSKKANVVKEFLIADWDVVSGFCQQENDIEGQTLIDAETIKVVVSAWEEMVSEICANTTMPSSSGLTDGHLYEVRIGHRVLLEEILDLIHLTDGSQTQRDVLRVISTGASRHERLSDEIRQELHDSGLAPDAIETVDSLVLLSCQDVSESLDRIKDVCLGSSTANIRKVYRVERSIQELKHLTEHLHEWGIRSIRVEPFLRAEAEYYNSIIYTVHVPLSGAGDRLAMIAAGGRYDRIEDTWRHDEAPPISSGITIGLEKVVDALASNQKQSAQGLRDAKVPTNVVVASKGGGGMLGERRRLVNELWMQGVAAELVPESCPSLAIQYEYAYSVGAKYLVLLSETHLGSANNVLIKSLEKRGDELIVSRNSAAKEVSRELTKRFSSLAASDAGSAPNNRNIMLKEYAETIESLLLSASPSSASDRGDSDAVEKFTAKDALEVLKGEGKASAMLLALASSIDDMQKKGVL